jgi:hypothetical protein
MRLSLCAAWKLIEGWHVHLSVPVPAVPVPVPVPMTNDPNRQSHVAQTYTHHPLCESRRDATNIYYKATALYISSATTVGQDPSTVITKSDWGSEVCQRHPDPLAGSTAPNQARSVCKRRQTFAARFSSANIRQGSPLTTSKSQCHSLLRKWHPTSQQVSHSPPPLPRSTSSSCSTRCPQI